MLPFQTAWLVLLAAPDTSVEGSEAESSRTTVIIKNKDWDGFTALSKFSLAALYLILSYMYINSEHLPLFNFGLLSLSLSRTFRFLTTKNER